MRVGGIGRVPGWAVPGLAMGGMNALSAGRTGGRYTPLPQGPPPVRGRRGKPHRRTRGPHRGSGGQAAQGDDDVKALQHMVVKVLGDSNALGPGRYDGKYGPKTHAAFMDAIKKLEIDGGDRQRADELRQHMENLAKTHPELQGRHFSNEIVRNLLPAVVGGTADFKTALQTFGGIVENKLANTPADPAAPAPAVHRLPPAQKSNALPLIT